MYSPPKFSSSFALYSIENYPKIVKEATHLIEGELYKNTMEEEMESLRKNETWYLVTSLDERITISSDYVFKKKTNAARQTQKYKASLVEKGYAQVKGVDFGEIYSLVAKVNSIRILISWDTTFDLEIEQMDMIITFLHGYVEEEIYMK